MPKTKPHVARRADDRDAEVGRRVRSRRLERKLSQTELAGKVGVTYQQVCKYESGANRIGAGRLQRIAEALGVPVSFFFDQRKEEGDDSVFALVVQTSGAMRVIKAFCKIKSRKAQMAVIDVAEQLASADAA